MNDRRFPLGLVGLDFPDLSLESLFRFAADEGLDHVDLYNRVNMTLFDLAWAGELSRKYRVAVNSLSSRAMPNTHLASFEDEVLLALESLEMAADLGVGFSESMVGASATNLTDDEAIDQYLNRIESLLDRAEELGVTVLVENVHDRDGGRDVTAGVGGTLRLLERSGGRLRVCWDSGNYLVNDPDDYDLTETLDRILPYTELIQIKDVQPIDDSNAHLEDTRLMREPVHGIWQAVPTGTGHAQAERVVEQLRSRGWNKPVSMEMFCSPGRRDYYWALTLKWMRERSLVG